VIHRSANRFNHVWRRVLQAFVPEGFPGSVTPDYVGFQLWDTLQVCENMLVCLIATVKFEL
jgi:hypothetical protein